MQLNRNCPRKLFDLTVIYRYQLQPSNWANRILELLNRTEEDLVFIKLLADLSLMNSPVIRDKSLEQFTFSELGVSVYALQGEFYSAHFHIAPVGLTAGSSTLPYVNDLPFGLAIRQTRQTIHTILGPPHQINRVAGPNQDQFKSESYRLESWEVTLWYSFPDENLHQLIVFAVPTALGKEALDGSLGMS